MMTKDHHNQVSSINRRVSPSRGFTLIELLLVLTIIGLMMALIIPRAMRAQTDSKYNLVRQYGSEMARYVMVWAETQARAQRESMNFTLKDFLTEDIPAEEVGFASKKLVEKYTGNDDYNGVEKLVAGEKLPRNPFNEASYFNEANDDDQIPSNKAGLLYLASRQDPSNRDYLNFYLLFTASASDEDEGSQWYGGMSHDDDDKIRLGVFVARLYDDQEYGGKEEDLFRWQEKNY